MVVEFFEARDNQEVGGYLRNTLLVPNGTVLMEFKVLCVYSFISCTSISTYQSRRNITLSKHKIGYLEKFEKLLQILLTNLHTCSFCN